MLVRHFKMQKVAMPKYRSRRVNEQALVLNTVLHKRKAKIKFLKRIWNLIIFTFLNPNSRKKNIMGGVSCDESLSSKCCLPRRILEAADITFSEHFWGESVLYACLVFRTEQPLKTFMYFPKAVLHPQSKEPKLLWKTFTFLVYCGLV